MEQQWTAVNEWADVEEGITIFKDILLAQLKNTPIPKKLDAQVFSKIYSACFKLCRPTHKHMPRLYQRFLDTVGDLAKILFVHLSKFIGDSVSILKEVARGRPILTFVVKCVCQVFAPLGEHYIPANEFPPLESVHKRCFTDVVLIQSKLYLRVRDHFISMIKLVRDEQRADLRVLINNMTEIFLEMHNYGHNYGHLVEVFILRATGDYYATLADDWFSKDSLSSYLRKADDFFMAEMDNVANYLPPLTSTKVLERVRESLRKNALRLLTMETKIFEETKVDDCSRIYRLLFDKPKCLDIVAEKLKKQIESQGMSLLNELDNAPMVGPSSLVHKMVDFNESYLEIVKLGFENHETFRKALVLTMKKLCNIRVENITFAERTANLCVFTLREDDQERSIDKVVRFINNISDKDLFAKFLSGQLAKWLLDKSNHGNENGKSLLSKLKAAYGASLTSKMEKMVQNMYTSNNLQVAEFLERVNSSNAGFKFDNTVLERSSWPQEISDSYVNLKLPPEMDSCRTLFEGFFTSSTQHKKLSYAHSMGRCTLSGSFVGNEGLEIDATTPQACILLLFNEADRLSYQDIKEQLNINDDEVMGLLTSLSNGCNGILRKDPNAFPIRPTDVFEVNSDFTHRLERIKLPLPRANEWENENFEEKVFEDRKHAIDAAIVRIMKARITLEYPKLVKECSDVLDVLFKPTLSGIKKRIEHLLDEKEFVIRDENDMDLLHYCEPPL